MLLRNSCIFNFEIQLPSHPHKTHQTLSFSCFSVWKGRSQNPILGAFPAKAPYFETAKSFISGLSCVVCTQDRCVCVFAWCIYHSASLNHGRHDHKTGMSPIFMRFFSKSALFFHRYPILSVYCQNACTLSVRVCLSHICKCIDICIYARHTHTHTHTHKQTHTHTHTVYPHENTRAKNTHCNTITSL